MGVANCIIKFTFKDFNEKQILNDLDKLNTTIWFLNDNEKSSLKTLFCLINKKDRILTLFFTIKKTSHGTITIREDTFLNLFKNNIEFLNFNSAECVCKDDFIIYLENLFKNDFEWFPIPKKF